MPKKGGLADPGGTATFTRSNMQSGPLRMGEHGRIAKGWHRHATRKGWNSGLADEREKKKKQKAGTNMPYLTYSPPGLHRGLFSTPPTTFYCWGLSDPCPPQLGWSVPSLLLSNCPPPCHVLQACLYLSFLVVWHGVCAIPAQSQWCGFVGGVLVVAVGCFVFKVSPHFLGSSRGSRTVASAHVLRTIFLVCCFCCLSVLCLVMVSLQTTV